MEIELTDLSGLPEGLKPLVQDNKLDLSKLMPAEDLTGLKTALQKERENVSAYGKLGKPDEIAAKIADLEKKAQGTGKGAEEAQAKLDALKQDYEGKLGAANDRLSKLMQQNAAASLKAELAKVGFIPEAIDDIAASALGRLQFHEDGSPKVLTSDGKPMIGNGPDHGATLADLAKELAEQKAYAVRDAGKGGSGKPPGSNGGTPKGKTVRASELESMTPKEKADYFRENPGVTITTE
ncbi:hypothetical protein P6F26_16785 [Roseibacterium sp. SDUM158017]|uniref:hypothetical protein n=1 Tax=Roseicyclus salinarum TaxID=3036773 RepID=UPI0024151B6B|nr:hypothetical protein [Roseibacterium sp. SDUM158017]MDG4650106.1 hypothetical protein [Roseibacterium sp. SDUM158017]